jgi:hypothetical protein
MFWVAVILLLLTMKVSSYMSLASSSRLRHSKVQLSFGDLENLTRVELQKLAKENGIKANSKSADLVSQLQALQPNKTEGAERMIVTQAREVASQQQVSTHFHSRYSL